MIYTMHIMARGIKTRTQKLSRSVLVMLAVTMFLGTPPVIYAAIPNDCDRWLAEYKHALLQKLAVRRLNAARHRAQMKLAGFVPAPHIHPVLKRRPHVMGPLERMRRFELQCDLGPGEPVETFSTPVGDTLPPLPVLTADLVFDMTPPSFVPQPTPVTPGEGPTSPIYFGGGPGPIVNPGPGPTPGPTPSPVPEPSSWIYVLTGAIAAGYFVRARNRVTSL